MTHVCTGTQTAATDACVAMAGVMAGVSCMQQAGRHISGFLSGISAEMTQTGVWKRKIEAN
jgi:hypothetical protein